jgi:hypothetical protein
MNRKHAFTCIGLAALAMGACTTSKSADPLSPTIAGPIPGVDITPPALMQPSTGAKIAVNQQPLMLVVLNASTSGVRPLTYLFEIAADVDFSNKVFSRDGIAPGGNGQTSLRLQDALAPGRTYFWHARAQDGANTGPFSAAAAFEVFTPIVINAPVLTAPTGNVKTASLHPRFTWNNAPRSGPAGAIRYIVELANSDSFANKLAIWTVDEQSGQNNFDSPSDLPVSQQIFWHVRAFDPTTIGPWSDTQVFQTPALVVVVTPTPGVGGTGHVGPGPLTADRAQQVVFGTAAEFPQLTQVFSTDQAAVDAATQLLLRTIWHLRLAGYQAAQQRNPSGLISGDKLTIIIDGSWHAYDIFSLGFAGRATTVQFLEISGANPVPNNGIPD